MEKSFTGTCPVQSKTYAVSVSYINARDFEEPIYVKGHFTCQYRKSAGNCDIDKCPIYASAPENL